MAITSVDDARQRLRARGGRLGRAVELATAVRDRARQDRVTIVAAGLAFYTVLSIVPALIATTALYTWLEGIASLARRAESWTTSFPDEVQRLVTGQLLEVAGMTGTGATLGLLLSILATFWAASKAARALMQALNIVSGVDDERSAPRRRGLAVAVTFAGVILAVLLLSLFDLTSRVSSSQVLPTILDVAFWLLLPVAVAGVAAVAYRYAPNTEPPPWSDVLPGALVTSGVFVATTAAMALYVATVGVGRAYGAMGAFVGGGLWLLVISWGLLIGAYVNAELAHRPERDADSTTTPG